MRAAAAVILAIWSTWLFSQPALAGKRVARAIGAAVMAAGLVLIARL